MIVRILTQSSPYAGWANFLSHSEQDWNLQVYLSCDEHAWYQPGKMPNPLSWLTAYVIYFWCNIFFFLFFYFVLFLWFKLNRARQWPSYRTYTLESIPSIYVSACYLCAPSPDRQGWVQFNTLILTNTSINEIVYLYTSTNCTMYTHWFVIVWRFNSQSDAPTRLRNLDHSSKKNTKCVRQYWIKKPTAWSVCHGRSNRRTR